MYIVLGRERLGDLRFGRYIVRFATKCPEDSNVRIYLLSNFTAFFPGRIELKKRSRGLCEAEVLLFEGEYPYVFVDSYWNFKQDPDNKVSREIDFYGRRIIFSIAEIGLERLERIVRSGAVYPEYIEHYERDPAYMSRYLEHYILRLRSLRDRVKKAYVEIDSSGDREILEMEKIYEDKYYEYYEAVVSKRFDKYRFILDLGGEKILYGTDGLYSEEFFEAKNVAGVEKPYWWLGSVYYQIFPDSYYNADPSNDPPSKISPEKVPRERGFIGGDLKGVIEKLSYIKSLGVDAIYLTPIYKSPSYHRYDVIDYKLVDPYLGSLEDFKKLLQEAHDRGLKIVLDIVPNHASPCSPYFLEAVREGANSENWGLFKFTVGDIESVEPGVLGAFYKYVESMCRDLPSELRDRKPFYESFIGSWAMAKWNHNNPRVEEFFKEVITYWLSMGVDGFRVDVGHGLPDHFLQSLYRHLVSEGGRDKIFILEIMGELRHYPLGVIADSAMNYELRGWVLDFFLYKSIDAYEFVSRLYSQYSSQPYYTLNSLYNLLGSHDTPRIYTLSGGDIGVLLSMYTFLFTIHGSPAIYYGDEIGLEGGGDPDNRRYMEWREEKWVKILLEHVKRLALLRRSLRPLRVGLTRVRALDRDTIAILRYVEEESVLSIVTRNKTMRRVVIRPRDLRIKTPLTHISIDLDNCKRIIHIHRSRMKIVY
ncbi:MAG: glycoside hydrolase family 13 protein [Sulfolobales archaeon]